MRKPTNLSDRIYRLILRVFPFDFRREYGAEMEGVFREEQTGMNRPHLWWKTAIGFLQSAPMEHLDVFRRDFRYGLRSLARKPLVALITFSVLSVGIGANTAIFSAMNMMLLRPLPVPSPEQVVRVSSGAPEGAVDYDEYLILRNQNHKLPQLAAFQDKQVTFRADGPPESLVATTVTGNYFDTLRVPALLGRAIEPNDDRINSPAVVMISEDFWKDRFGRDPSVLGRTVHIDGRPFTVIGISPESFGGADRDVSRDLWLPWNGPQHGQPRRTNMIGRLEAGASIRQAEADLAVIASQFKQDRSPQDLALKVREARMVPLVIRGQVVPIFVLFIGLVGVSLMIPCLNIGSLLLARSSERRREMGIRLALGAGRGQLARQVLTETFVIGLGAGIVGIGLFAGTLVILISRFEFSADYASRLVLDWRVAAFSLGLSLITTFMFGFAPAFHSARTEVLVALKEGGVAGPVSRSRVRAGFVIGQVAISALLLALSGLFVRSLTSPQLADAGFVADGVLLAGINLSTASGPDFEFYEGLIQNLEVSPLVLSASISEANGPLGAGAAKARSSGTAQDDVSYSTYAVSRGHFRTLGVPLLEGRDFNEGDSVGGPRVGIVNESLARKQWPGQSPIGKTISGIEIVGLARNAKYLQNSEVANQFLYVPLSQNPTPFVTLFVKASGDARSVLPQVRDVVARLDPDLPISNVMTVETLANLSLSPLRVVATLAAVLGTLASGLAAMGIYGTVAFLTRQRTREIGIRMAMGATASRIVICVTQQSLRWIVTGLALGLGTAFIVSKALPGMIYGVLGSDPVTYLAVILVLGGTAYTACWIPARRASRTDPLAALREE